MRIAILLTLLAAVAVAAQPLGQLGAQLGMNPPFTTNTGGMQQPAPSQFGMGGVGPMGTINMQQPQFGISPMQQMQMQQPIQQLQQPIQQPMQLQQPIQQPLQWQQLQQPQLNMNVPTVGLSGMQPSGLSGLPLNNVLSSIGAQPVGAVGTVGVQPTFPVQQMQPMLGAATTFPMQQPMQMQLQQPAVGLNTINPINTFGTIGTNVNWQQPMQLGLSAPLSQYSPLTSSAIGQPQFQNGVQLQTVTGTIAPVLPQDFGRPVAGVLQQPVISEQQANQLVPISQLQQQLNQRVAQLPGVVPVQNMQQPIMPRF